MTVQGRSLELFFIDGRPDGMLTAAAIVAGRSANGRTSWVLPSTGQTYADWEEALVQATEGQPA
ncbi:MAG: DUF4357 domain-containing protein [Rhodobacterales bacterium]